MNQWRVEYRETWSPTREVYIIIPRDPEPDIEMYFCDEGDQEEQLAYLIAAAPELLAVCRLAHDEMITLITAWLTHKLTPEMLDVLLDNWVILRDRSRAAIAKVEEG